MLAFLVFESTVGIILTREQSSLFPLIFSNFHNLSAVLRFAEIVNHSRAESECYLMN